MRKRSGLSLILLILIGLFAWGINCSDSSTNSNTDPTADDTTGTTDSLGAIIAGHLYAFDPIDISTTTLDQIRSSYNIFYGHTSHGSQIIAGLQLLLAEDDRYALPTIFEYGSDLGQNGDTAWVAPTRAWLNGHPECNMVIWSWCGGCSDNTEQGINIYLNAMTQLENTYPNVRFVYMTGHLDGTGPEGTLYRCNNQIRTYCSEHGKLLYDFADIESYDPDGTYYPNETDACAWCESWCATHDCPSCDYCAHSHCFNCYRKGQAFWHMMEAIVAD